MNKQESFPVLSIDREDINHAVGYALGPELSDEQMRVIASKYADALVALKPWNILADVMDSIAIVSIDQLLQELQDTIAIEVESGMVTAVTGLPEGYDYEIIDHDVAPEVETHAKCLDVSPAAEELLQEFKSALDRVQYAISDTDGALFACFPFQFSQENMTCRGVGKTNPDSPVCVLCRELHGCEGTSPTWPKKGTGQPGYPRQSPHIGEYGYE